MKYLFRICAACLSLTLYISTYATVSSTSENPQAIVDKGIRRAIKERIQEGFVRELFPFNWETVCAFTPYDESAEQELRRLTQANVEVPWLLNESVWTLAFVSSGAKPALVKVDRNSGIDYRIDFRSPRCHERASAKYTIRFEGKRGSLLLNSK